MRVFLPSLIGGAAFALVFYAWQTERADRLHERWMRRQQALAERDPWYLPSRRSGGAW